VARDDDGFVEFVATRRPALRRLAYALSGDWHLAEDIVQNALIKTYIAWPRLQRQGGEDAYVRRVVATSFIDETRRPSRRERPVGKPQSDQATLEGWAEPGPIVSALQQLPAQQRACVVLRHWQDLSVAETAQTLGITQGSVKSHTSRGVERMRGLLEGESR
jgi:RNA polymerase sigma-70 factor (sigma-E family)